jgi:hypothetical protein
MSGLLDDVMGFAKQESGLVDPYLPEALCRIDQIRALRKNRSFVAAVFGKRPTVEVPTCTQTPLNTKGGVGVVGAIRPLRGAAYVYQHPTVVALGIAAVVSIPYLLGYVHGRRSR